MRRRSGLAAATVAIASSWPALAQACAVCGADGGSSRSAFFWTTVVLSLVPLGLFAGGLWYLRRAARDWMRDELADPTDAVPATEATRPRGAGPAPSGLVTDAR
jgi:hypothetical protein